MARLVSALPRLLSRYRLLRAPLRLLHRYAIRKRPSMRPHPFDAAYGISTSGYLPWWLLRADLDSDRENSGYAGCQPSCLRRALSTIPDPSRFVFLDVGCGKGRSMVIASEFKFQRILGVEIAPKLAAAARRNAAILRRRYPDRIAIEVIEADATLAQIPGGDIVVFLYNPFGRPLFERFISRLIEVSGHREIFVVYESPVNGDFLDSMAGFRRWHAETVFCEPLECGYAPEDREAVITWQWGGDRFQPPWPGADARIVNLPGRPELEPASPGEDGLPQTAGTRT